MADGHSFRFIGIEALDQRTLLSVSPNIHFLNNQSEINAGQAVFVDAVQTGLAIGAELGVGTPLTARYQWDFGDTTAGSRYNQLPGWNAGHVYDVPGIYTITLTITNQAGDVGTTQQTVQVDTPPAGQIIYVDSTLTAAAPDPNGGVDVPSLAQALPYLGNNAQMLFRRGETFLLTQVLSIPFSNVTIGAYGTGSSPVIQLPSGSTQYFAMVAPTATATGTVIRDLQFTAAGSSRIGIAIQPQGTGLVVRNCNFQNLDDALNENMEPVGVLAMDNTAGVLKEYFAYIKGTDHVYLGNTVADSTGQHNFRTYGIRVLCYGNDITNLPGGSSIDTLRVNDGAWIYWANNNLHDGQVLVGPLGPDSAGSAPGSGISWVVIENNRLSQVSGQWLNNNRLEIDAGVQHVVVRNNYIESTDANAIAVYTRATLTWKSNQLPASPIPLPPVTITKTSVDVLVLNNTVINPNLGDGTHLGKKGCFIQVSGTTTNAVTLQNNLYIAPNLDTTAYSAAAVQVVSRNDLNNFTNGGIANNDWPKPSNATTRGVNYVSNGSLSGTAAYYTPAEWASAFPSKVSGEKFENLKTSDLNASLLPPVTSLAANGASPVSGVFTDLYGLIRTGNVWTVGGVQLS